MRADSNYGPGVFHEGFLSVANQLWDNGMREALDAAVAAGDVGHIIITGHSLGGASTTLLAARAQVRELDQTRHLLTGCALALVTSDKLSANQLALGCGLPLCEVHQWPTTPVSSHCMPLQQSNFTVVP